MDVKGENACERLDAPPLGGRGVVCKNDGTLGTLGILARLLGKFERFSRLPKDANGTLETTRMGRDVGGPGGDEVLKNVGGLGGLGGLALFLGKYAMVADRHKAAKWRCGNAEESKRRDRRARGRAW
jgi:hypothetical protein